MKLLRHWTSRILNILTLGDDWTETFCSRVYRQMAFNDGGAFGIWRRVGQFLDWAWFRLSGQQNHCYRQWRKHVDGSEPDSP